MSLPSPTASGKNNPPGIVIVGGSWSGPVFANAFSQLGHPVELLILHSDALAAPPPRTLAVSVGNGECFENARRIFGDSLAAGLWEPSRENFARAKHLLTDLGVEFAEEGARWFGATAREKDLFVESARAQASYGAVADTARVQIRDVRFEVSLGETAFTFDRLELEQALEKRRAKDGIGSSSTHAIAGIERRGVFDYRIRFQDGGTGASREISSPVVVMVSDLLPPGLFPSFSDKFLQVTLGSFSFRKREDLGFSAAFFNAGADFAISEGTHLRLGSFRNLYEDKAVGIHPQPDPATLKGVSRFFGALGWIDPEEKPEPHTSVETLTCDGLPFAGALPDYPGVYVVGGFGGRTQNYLFQVADYLAAGILGAGDFQKLALFSTKRFV